MTVVKAVVTLLRVDEDEDPAAVLAGLESAISCSGISDFELEPVAPSKRRSGNHVYQVTLGHREDSETEVWMTRADAKRWAIDECAKWADRWAMDDFKPKEGKDYFIFRMPIVRFEP